MGTPVYDDATLFEFLILETFQAGLSWITILNKGRISGKHLTISTIKNSPLFRRQDQALLLDAGIIRNKLKVRSAVTNAIAFMKSRKNLAVFYIWAFTNGTPIINHKTLIEYPPLAHFLTPLAQI
jgi:DNA-3-methyladenine glycosylase I